MSVDTVTVACKLPNGLHLENIVNGAKVRVTVHGNRLPMNADGLPITTHEVAGSKPALLAESYGLTPGVPRDFWEQWAKENASYPPFAKGLIFAQGEHASARAQATELTELRTGLEPMNRAKPGTDLEPVAPA